MAVFGTPVAHEDDALRAVRAAVDCQGALDVLNADLRAVDGLEIEIRIGVHTGEVVVSADGGGEALASGAPMATAARLEQTAEPGEALLGPVTHALVRDAVRAEPVAGLLLRGVASEVTAWRLLGLTGTESHVRHLATPLVGRVEELAVLTAALQRSVVDRSVQLVTVVGAAGVGKSRLVGAFLDHAAREARVTRGRCLPYGDGITYWPIVEILNDLAGVDPLASREEAADRIATLVPLDLDGRARIVGILGALTGTSSGATSGDDIAWAVRRTLGALAAERPLVLLIEDIHWAEPGLLDLLETVVDWTTGAPLMMVCPARTDLFERRPDWGAERSNARRLDLGPLGGADTRELLAALPGGSALPAALRARVLAAAEGNPLFVEEMLGKMIDDGTLRNGPAGWVFDGAADAITVPVTVSALIAARIDALDRPERSAAERASVVGRVFERGAVSELSTIAERGTLSGRLLALTRKQLITPDGSGLDGDDAFRFRHVLIRDAAYDRLSKSDRADLHERFAEWLERSTADRAGEYVELLAHHLAAAAEYRLELGTLTSEHGDRLAAAAVDRLTEAAEHATAVFAHPEAARLYGRALSILERRPGTAVGRAGDLTDLEARHAEALFLAADPWAAVDAIRRTLARLDESAASRAAVLGERLAVYLIEAGDEAGALAAAADAVARVPSDPPTPERALVLANQARILMLLHRDAEALAACDEGIAAARAAGADHELASVLITQATLIGRMDLSRGAELLEDAHRFAERIHDARQMLRADNNLGLVLARLRDYARWDEVFERAMATAAAAGLERTNGAGLLVNAGHEALWASRPSRAFELYARVLALTTSGDDVVNAQNGLGWALILRGEHEAALEGFAAARRVARRGARNDRIADIATGEAWALCQLGRLDEALARLDEVPRDESVVQGVRVQTGVYRTMVQASIAVAARSDADPDREAAAIRAMVAAAETAREAARQEADDRWQTRALLAVIRGELARGSGHGGSEAWAGVAEETAEIGDLWQAAYARLRHVQALVAEGASTERIRDAIAGARAITERTEAADFLRDLDALAAANA